MSRPLEDVLNEGNPSKLGAGQQQIRLGRALRENSARFAQGTVAANLLVLPNNAKAAQLLDGYARVGGTTGRLEVAEKETTPAVTQAAVSPTGDIEFAAADAVTDAEATYMPMEGDLITEVIPVTAAGVGTFLQGRASVLLIAATLDTGAAPGVKTIVARTGAPGVGDAALNDLGQATFNGADVGASPETATVTYIARPNTGTGVANDLGTRLASQVDF